MFFFFSSRRRHTRYIGDWSSDVCSSDLVLLKASAQCRLSFSWAEVKRHCAEAFKSTTPPLDEWELPGSFRLSRKIAALANELFDPSITQDGKFRHVERADPADLPQTGEVRVVVVPGAAKAVVKALR